MADVITCNVGATLAQRSVAFLNYVCQYIFEINMQLLLKQHYLQLKQQYGDHANIFISFQLGGIN
jgi:hypothetical protein